MLDIITYCIVGTAVAIIGYKMIKPLFSKKQENKCAGCDNYDCEIKKLMK